MASHDLHERAPLPVPGVRSRVASDMSQAADPRAKLTGRQYRHLLGWSSTIWTVARIAQALGVS